MRSLELANLVGTIEHSIAIRGLYWLADEGIDLICGKKTLPHLDDPGVTTTVAEFSAAHGWSVVRREGGFLFLPRTGEIDFSNF